MESEQHFNWLRLLPLLILALGLGAFFYFRLYEYVNFASLKKHHDTLHAWTQANYLIAVLSFIGTYIILTAISAPGAIFITLAGGFLFGFWRGALFVDIGATIGATLIFLAAKTALHDVLYKKASGTLHKLRQGFQKNAVNYLLFLRLVPLFPFWLVNIAPAFLGVKTKTFFFTTLVGILPGTCVYVWLGTGLSEIFATDKTPNLKIILQPNILLPIIALALLSLVPIIYQRIKQYGKK